jgi:hypothetical protein
MLRMRRVKIGSAEVTGLCIGGNPFSGFAHQTPERAVEMKEYYTPDRIKATLRLAEESGINTFFGRTDDHVMGILREYYDDGGKIQWFAQICTERDDEDAWRKWTDASAALGATGGYLHGGVVDHWYSEGRWNLFREALDRMRGAGLATGFAGHMPEAHRWIRDHLDVDFQMCSYYNPTDRSKVAHHTDVGERWEYEDRARMLEVIASIEKPVVHYKVFAAANKPILEAFETMGRSMRSGDVACIGIFIKDDPRMIAEDIELFERYVDRVPPGGK